MANRTTIHATLPTGEEIFIWKSNLGGVRHQSEIRANVIFLGALNQQAEALLHTVPQQITIADAVTQILGFTLVQHWVDTRQLHEKDKYYIRVGLSYEVQKSYPADTDWKRFMEAVLDALVRHP